MRSFLGKTPFFRLLLPVVISILLNSLHTQYNTESVILGIVGLSVMILSTFIKKRNRYRHRWLFGSGVVILLLSLTQYSYHKQIQSTQLNIGDKSDGDFYIATIIDIPETKPRSIALNVKTSFPKYKKITLYLETSDESGSLKPGDEIVFFAKLEPFKNFGNPDDFDYARFMKIKGFAGSGYASSSDWQKTGRRSISIYGLSQLVRFKALNFYRSFNLSEDAYAFISALTLGYKKDLPDKMQEAFRVSGTAHVLAVSGLHVGIIYMVINLMFSFLGKKGRPHIVRQLLIIVLLWGYVFFTGMSASVIRAAIMLTICCVANMKNRKGITINTLSAAAFIILIFKPLTLFDISFQMSFGAVLSILYFQPKIQNLYSPSKKTAQIIWSLFTVSLSAQIGVFPFVLYYFGTFPTYFLITNMLVVPLVSLIIYTTIPLILLNFLFVVNIAIFEPVRALFHWLVKSLIQATLQIVHITESLPNAQLYNIHVSLMQTILILAFIYILTAWLYKKRSSLLIAALSIGLTLLLTVTYNILFPEPAKLVVFNSTNKSDISIYFKNSRHFIDTPKNGLIPHSEKTIVRLSDKAFERYYTQQRFDIDILILSEDKNFNIEKILDIINPSTIVLDSSLPKTCSRSITSKCKVLGINVHDVSNDGAFSVNI